MKAAARWLLVGNLMMLSLTAQAPVAAAGGDPSHPLTAAEIVDRSVAARGGAQAWHKVQTMRWTGHVESGRGGTGQPAFVMMFMRPNATRFELVSQGVRSVRIFDGGKGWKLHATETGIPALTNYSDEEISSARDAAGLDGPLFDYAAKGVAIALAGKDKVDDREVYRLNVTLPSGHTGTEWIDAQTFLELRHDRQAQVGGVARTVSVYYRNYRSVDGLVMPFVIETGSPADSADRLIIDDIVINPMLDGDLFSRPQLQQDRRPRAVIDTTASR